MRFWDTVELYASEEVTDADGTPRREVSATAVESTAVVQPRTSTEESAEGQRTVMGLMAFLPSTVSIDAWAQVRWRGVLYEVDGDPIVVSGPRGIHHIEAQLRRVR